MNKIRYIGSFPPPYGGVTIKNDLLVRRLTSFFHVAIPPRNGGLASIVAIIWSLFSRKPLLVGISSVRGKSLLITKLLFDFNRKTMKKSLYFMMGGTEAKRISQDKAQIKMYSSYKRVFVETKIMQKQLTEVGMTNVSVYPNCRENVEVKSNNVEKNQFRCVYFSLISVNKGADLVFRAAENNPDIIFDFYGEIDPAYESAFHAHINSLANASYKGVFKSNEENVYQKLSEYDALLFPSRWKNEGVPGILIEAKIAGIPVIASDIAYNSEIINNYEDGIVFATDNYDEFNDCIKKLSEDTTLCIELREGAKKTSKNYIIDSYLDEIVKLLHDK